MNSRRNDGARSGERAVVVCSGEATLDHVFEVSGPALRLGDKHVAVDHRRRRGGVAANAAVAIARLGGHAVFVGCVGDDARGDEVAAGLSEEGVDITHLVRVAGVETSVSAVLTDRTGARTIVNHTPDELFKRPAPTLLVAGARAVLDDGRWPAATEMTLRFALSSGIPGVVDVDRIPSDPRQRDVLLQLGSHLLFGAQSLAEFTGVDDPVVALHRANTRAAGHVGVTLGAHGVCWLDGDDVRSLEAFAVDVVDTAGAGDVFHGAFALALAEGMNRCDAFRFASAAAALTCSAWGARDGTPRRCAVDEFLAARSNSETPA